MCLCLSLCVCANVKDVFLSFFLCVCAHISTFSTETKGKTQYRNNDTTKTHGAHIHFFSRVFFRCATIAHSNFHTCLLGLIYILQILLTVVTAAVLQRWCAFFLYFYFIYHAKIKSIENNWRADEVFGACVYFFLLFHHHRLLFLFLFFSSHSIRRDLNRLKERECVSIFIDFACKLLENVFALNIVAHKSIGIGFLNEHRTSRRREKKEI